MNDLNPTPEFEEKVRRALDVPDANPEFVKKLRADLARRPVVMRPRFVLRPAWVFASLIVTLALIASAPFAVNALKRLFGYVPGVGLVENVGGIRMLAEPVSVTCEGVTVTVTQAMVYEDRVELTYEVAGIKENYSNAPDMCGSYHPDNGFWSDADADLRLPDGTLVRRDYAGEFQFANRYAMKPVYAVQVPADALELTMVLKCIPFTRLGSVPENWEVPFKLIAVPEGTVVGEPVIEVEQPTVEPTLEVPASSLTEEPALPAPVVTMTLEKIVPLDSATIFYLSLDMENKDPSLISIMPVDAYVVDSQGQKIDLIGGFVWQPFQHRPGSLFEFRSASKPADGALTVVIENAVAYYAPMYVEPRQATPEEMSFTFDAGANPQAGQTWDLNNGFDIAGYPLQVTSVRAVTWSEVQEPSYIDGSQGYEFGYQFTVESDPSIKMSAEMDIMSESPMCGLTVGSPFIPTASSLQYTQLCRDTYPSGSVIVTIRELAVLMENTWQTTWVP
jgi:hypothetical protein